MTTRPIARAQLLVGSILALALTLAGPSRLAAQEAEPAEAADEPVVEASGDVEDPGPFHPEDPAAIEEEEGSNLWWFPGVIGIVTAAVSVSGFVNVRAEIETLKDQRAQAEVCRVDPGDPACVELGPFGRALLESPEGTDVCAPETAAGFGIGDICEQRDRHNKRKKVYLTVGTLGLLVGIGSFIAFGILQGRDDEDDQRTALVRPWMSFGRERGAGLALDLTF